MEGISWLHCETSNALNDYRPVALTSVDIKTFERLEKAYLKASMGPLLDSLQFAYRENRSVDDAVNMGLHFILQHLDRPGTYVRTLFVDFSSDHQVPDRPAAGSEAGKILIQHPHDQYWSSSGLCCLPTALLPVHK